MKEKIKAIISIIICLGICYGIFREAGPFTAVSFLIFLGLFMFLAVTMRALTIEMRRLAGLMPTLIKLAESRQDSCKKKPQDSKAKRCYAEPCAGRAAVLVED